MDTQCIIDLLVQNGLFRFTFQKYPDEVDDCKQVSLYTKFIIAKICIVITNLQL